MTQIEPKTTPALDPQMNQNGPPLWRPDGQKHQESKWFGAFRPLHGIHFRDPHFSSRRPRIHLIGNGELWKMITLIGFVSGIIKYGINYVLRKSGIAKKDF